eukprot:6202612-Pleurochrysis_carterae.AAC.1
MHARLDAHACALGRRSIRKNMHMLDDEVGCLVCPRAVKGNRALLAVFLHMLSRAGRLPACIVSNSTAPRGASPRELSDRSASAPACRRAECALLLSCDAKAAPASVLPPPLPLPPLPLSPS